jgi:hypothetical protein
VVLIWYFVTHTNLVSGTKLPTMSRIQMCGPQLRRPSCWSSAPAYIVSSQGSGASRASICIPHLPLSPLRLIPTKGRLPHPIHHLNARGVRSKWMTKTSQTSHTLSSSSLFSSLLNSLLRSALAAIPDWAKSRSKCGTRNAVHHLI